MTETLPALRGPQMMNRHGELLDLSIIPQIEEVYPLVVEVDALIDALRGYKARLINVVEIDLHTRGGNSRLVGNQRYVAETRRTYDVDAKRLYKELFPLIEAGELTKDEREAAIHEEVKVTYVADNRLLNELAKRGPVKVVIDGCRRASVTVKIVAKQTVDR